MEINRSVIQGGTITARHRLKFCLDRLEEADDFRDVDWSTEIVHHLTIEELIGALVAAEQAMEP